MTGQWKTVKRFILSNADELIGRKLSDTAFLQYFLWEYAIPIPLDSSAELYAHQSGPGKFVAKMIQPQFLVGMGTVKLDMRRSFPNVQDWYLDKRLNGFKTMIVGREWQVEGLPAFLYETGGTVGGRGTVSIVAVQWE